MSHENLPLLDVLLGRGTASRPGAPEPTLLPWLVPHAPESALPYLCYLAEHFSSRGMFAPWPALGGAVLEAVARRVPHLDDQRGFFTGSYASSASLVVWFGAHESVESRASAVRARLARLGGATSEAVDVEEAMQRSMRWLPLAVDCRNNLSATTEAAGKAADALYGERLGVPSDDVRVSLLIHFLPYVPPAERADAVQRALDALAASNLRPWLRSLALSRLDCAGTPGLSGALAPLVVRLAQEWTPAAAAVLTGTLADAPFADVLRAHPGAGRLTRLEPGEREAVLRELGAQAPQLARAILREWGGAGPPKILKRAKPPRQRDTPPGPQNVGAGLPDAEPTRGGTAPPRGDLVFADVDEPPPTPAPPQEPPPPSPAARPAAPPGPAVDPRVTAQLPPDRRSPLLESVSGVVVPGAEPVDAAVFSPPRVAKASTFLVQVMLYPPASAAAAESEARRADATADRLATFSLPLDLAPGTRVDVRLEMPALRIDEPDAAITWRGRIAPVQFEVSVPDSALEGNAIGRVRFAIAGVPAGTMRFQVSVVAVGTPAADTAPLEVRARRYRTAFVSYASADRSEVLRRVQAFKIAGLEVFQDVLSLEPGELWEKGLYKAMDACDVFLLFWSKAALASTWVDKEIDYVLARKQGDAERPPDIQPVPIEGPPIVVPPAKLGHLHFNDALLAHIKAATSAIPTSPAPQGPQ